MKLLTPSQFANNIYNQKGYGITIASHNNGYITTDTNQIIPFTTCDRLYIQFNSISLNFSPVIENINGVLIDNGMQYYQTNIITSPTTKVIPHVYPMYIAIAETPTDPLPSQQNLYKSLLNHKTISFGTTTSSLYSGSPLTLSTLQPPGTSNTIYFLDNSQKTLLFQLSTTDPNALSLVISAYYYISPSYGFVEIEMVNQTLSAVSGGQSFAGNITIGDAIGYVLTLSDTSTNTTPYPAVLRAQIENV
ncbi:MAG: hypothetical protein QXE51_02655 [Nitrososphaeria archaeon]